MSKDQEDIDGFKVFYNGDTSTVSLFDLDNQPYGAIKSLNLKLDIENSKSIIDIEIYSDEKAEKSDLLESASIRKIETMRYEDIPFIFFDSRFTGEGLKKLFNQFIIFKRIYSQEDLTNAKKFKELIAAFLNDNEAIDSIDNFDVNFAESIIESMKQYVEIKKNAI